MNLQVELLEKDTIQCFKIVGEIDAFTVPLLKERLEAIQSIQGLQAELDLSDVTYIDSTGLGVIVGFYKSLKENEGNVKITGANSRLKRLFEITGLDGIIEIVEEEGGSRDATV